MATTQNQKQQRDLFSFLRRGPQWLEVDDYQVGDVHTQQPVRVTPNTTMVGNIIAPTIEVAGLLYGSTAARETTIKSGGQIWGDVYSGSIRIEPGGAVQGWISSLDEKEYEDLYDRGTIPQTAAMSSPEESIPEDGQVETRSESQITALSRLRAEAATAKAARAELEHAFEKRLSEVAGEASAEVVNLRQELAATRTELAATQEHKAELEETLAQREAQIGSQTEELTETRRNLADKIGSLEQLQANHDEIRNNLNELQTLKEDLEVNLHTAQEEIDDLKARNESLESALQDNLQHSTEQEESLIRWQELSDHYEARVKELENELEEAQSQLDENQRLIQMLRDQRSDLETQWEKAVKDGYLAEAKKKVEDQANRLLWQQADLETTRAELEETRRLAAEQDELVQRLQQEQGQLREQLAAQREAKATAQRQKEQINTLQNQLNQLKEESDAEMARLRKSLRHTTLQMEATEKELERHLEEASTQGRHLAEIQAHLVERDLELKEMRKTAVSRAQTILKLKRLAGARIRKLETQLDQSRQQVKELKAFIQRRRQGSD